LAALQGENFMKTQYDTVPCWSTTANNQGANNFPAEASVLGEHLNHCKKPYGRMFGVVCAADAMHGFAASRFITTLVAVALLIAISSLVM
jgi:hypothetical protein